MNALHFQLPSLCMIFENRPAAASLIAPPVLPDSNAYWSAARSGFPNRPRVHAVCAQRSRRMPIAASKALSMIAKAGGVEQAVGNMCKKRNGEES